MPQTRRRANTARPASRSTRAEVDSFLAIHPDGSVTVYTGKVDVGTGLRIAVRQMAAEELGLPVERITLVEGDTGLTPDQGGTGGSTGLTRGGSEVRQAAATARRALLNLGAEQLKRPAAELTLADGQVRPAAGGPGVAIGTLIGGKPLSLKVDPKAPLQESHPLSSGGQAAAATRRAREVHRQKRLLAGLHAAGDAAWARDPAARHRRQAALGG